MRGHDYHPHDVATCTGWVGELSRRREDLGWTKYDVDRLSGLRTGTYSSFERHPDNPRLRTAQQYGRVLGMTARFLVEVPTPDGPAAVADLYAEICDRQRALEWSRIGLWSRLRAVRHFRGMTLADVGAALTCSPRAVNWMERAADSHLTTVLRYARAVDATVRPVWCVDDPPLWPDWADVVLKGPRPRSIADRVLAA